jgi:putative phage-type endonuclease
MTQPALIAPGRRVTPTAYRVLAADVDERAWLDERRRGIGSSDVAAILGVAERRSALHVWYDKTGRYTDDDAGEAALWGKLHEDTVAREWARRNRSTVRRVGVVAHVDQAWMRCTLDRQVGVCPLDRERSASCALEVKTRNAFVAGKWRREIPDDVLAQVVWQMAVTGYAHIHVACLIGGNDYRQYIIRRDAELERDIVAAASAFWSGNVLLRHKPAVDVEAYADDLVDLDNRVHRDRAPTADLDGFEAHALIRDYETNRLHAQRYEQQQKAARARMVLALDGAEAAVAEGDPRRDPMWTYFEQNRRPGVDLAQLAERWPDAYAACITEKSGRTLAIAASLRLKEDDLADQQSA